MVANPVAALPASHNDLCVQPVQVTQRLTLRQFTLADADDLLCLDGDPRVMRFLEPRLKTRAQIEAEVLPRLLACYDRHPALDAGPRTPGPAGDSSDGSACGR